MRVILSIIMCLLPFSVSLANGFKCPDDNINMVVAYGVGEAEKDAKAIFKWGEKASFKVKLLSPGEHTKYNMLNYMQCERLSFFFNISHSSSTDIILGDNSGTLSGRDIGDNVDFKDNTIFYTHSCNSGGGTTYGSLVNGMRRAKARAFIGTSRSVTCGGNSEDITVTKCVIKRVLIKNVRFDDAINECTARESIPNFLVINDFNKNLKLSVMTNSLKASIEL